MDTNKKTMLTKEGLEKLKAELNTLVTKKRPKIIKMVQSTRVLGDISENAGYQSAREDLTRIDDRINELEEIIKNSSVKSADGSKTVEVGSKVTLKEKNGNLVIYELVGVSESDPLNNKISYESPIGKAILKKKVGDEAIVVTPNGQITFEITKLE